MDTAEHRIYTREESKVSTPSWLEHPLQQLRLLWCSLACGAEVWMGCSSVVPFSRTSAAQ
jgi:hypothetical protein